jgi:hypothetical protein
LVRTRKRLGLTAARARRRVDGAALVNVDARAWYRCARDLHVNRDNVRMACNRAVEWR